MEKAAVLEACRKLVEDTLAELHSREEELQESLLSDTKSTAGDKHETARAMTHLEQEKLQGQLAQWRSHKQALDAISPEQEHAAISQGTLVQTDSRWFLIGVSLGKIEVGSDNVFALSSASPMGRILMGRKAGDVLELNGLRYEVLKIQ